MSKHKESVIFFPGYDMYHKHYKSYFPSLNLLNYKDYNKIPKEFFDFHTLAQNGADEITKGSFNKDIKHILTHSVGLINAILWCNKNSIKNLCIIAIDPPDLDIETIKNKLESGIIDKYENLKSIYKEFLESKINLKNYNIKIYRHENKIVYLDTFSYNNTIVYYENDTHYPYMFKKERDIILKLF